MAELKIKEGDTLSELARKNNTTVSELQRINNIQNPDVIQSGATLTLPEGRTSTISATDVVETSPLAFSGSAPDDTSVNRIFDLTAGTAGLTEDLNKQFEENQKRLEELGKSKTQAEEDRGTIRGRIEDIVGKRPSSEFLLEREQSERGVEGDLNLTRGLIGEIGGLRTQLANLKTEGQLQIEALSGQGRGIPLSIIQGQQAKTQRQNSIRQAGVAAELGAKSATLQALQGNISLAQKLAKDAVDAELFDFKQELQDYNELFELNEDIIDSLDDETRTLLEDNRDEARRQLDEAREDKDKVAGLMVDNPKANISLSDTFEEAAKKVADAGGSLAARKESRLEEGGDTGGTFTVSQVNKGASRAGIPIAEFQTLGADVKNFYVNAPNESVDTINETLTEIANGKLDSVEEKELIDESNLPTAVKLHVKNQIDAIAVDTGDGGSGGGFIGNTWDAIKNFLK